MTRNFIEDCCNNEEAPEDSFIALLANMDGVTNVTVYYDFNYVPTSAAKRFALNRRRLGVRRLAHAQVPAGPPLALQACSPASRQ